MFAKVCNFTQLNQENTQYGLRCHNAGVLPQLRMSVFYPLASTQQRGERRATQPIAQTVTLGNEWIASQKQEPPGYAPARNTITQLPTRSRSYSRNPLRETDCARVDMFRLQFRLFLLPLCNSIHAATAPGVPSVTLFNGNAPNVTVPMNLILPSQPG